jgi:hypothetical protein
MVRVYLDNVVASGRVLGDLRPASEMKALEEIEHAHLTGKIKRNHRRGDQVPVDSIPPFQRFSIVFIVMVPRQNTAVSELLRPPLTSHYFSTSSSE